MEEVLIQARKGSAQIYGIDVLRFVAAGLVLLYHLSFAIWASPNRRAPAELTRALEPLGAWMTSGWVGVEIFFVISGYVIAFTANGRTPIGFLNSRILRLVPAVLLCASLTIPALFYLGVPLHNITKQYIGSLLFLPLGPWVAGPYWTLPVEIAFYLVIFVLLLTDSFCRVELAAILLGMASLASWALYYLVPPHAGAVPKLLAWLMQNRPGQVILLHHGIFFAIGIMLWLLRHSGASFLRLAALLAFGLVGVAEIIAQARSTALFMLFPVDPIASAAIWLVAMIGLGLSIRFNDVIAGRLFAWATIIRSIGLMTFPLYLLHEPIGTAVIVAMRRHDAGASAALLAGICVSLCLAASVALVLEPALRAVASRLLIHVESRMPVSLQRLRTPTSTVDSVSRSIA